ncbi:MAG: ribbon-helix-helix protein, CopG family [Solirubrobacteraceae bacterium]|nr:ribbon-helix-helix protein, CopG family [Solirubrobacteraceae bacterium]
MLQRRLQVLIDDERHERLQAIAKQRGISIGAVVREALDRGLASPDARRQGAAARLLGAPPMEVPSVPELLEELEELRGRRG